METGQGFMQAARSTITIPDFMTATLIAAGDGVEMIHHRLEPLTLWTLEPEPSSSRHFEAIYITSGELRCAQAGAIRNMTTGDSISFQPTSVRFVCQATEPTEFIYVSSEPVYQSYFGALAQVRTLAVGIEEKDGYTADHCSRIMKKSVHLGLAMGLSADDLYRLQFAAFFHDLGKTQIPLEILTKNGPLTESEWLEMKRHPLYGCEILLATADPQLAAAAPIVAQHHERHDGSGYPNHLRGDEIDISAAIIGVVDSYDAMTSQRSYSRARSHAEAVAEIQSLRGRLYHPDVVDHFLVVFG